MNKFYLCSEELFLAACLNTVDPISPSNSPFLGFNLNCSVFNVIIIFILSPLPALPASLRAQFIVEEQIIHNLHQLLLIIKGIGTLWKLQSNSSAQTLWLHGVTSCSSVEALLQSSEREQRGSQTGSLGLMQVCGSIWLVVFRSGYRGDEEEPGGVLCDKLLENLQVQERHA